MGLLDKIFPNKEKERQRLWAEETYFKTLTAYAPKFSTWDGCIYESELVRASVDAVARRFSKLNVKIEGTAKPILQTQLKKAPNSFQTWSQFLYRLATILYIQNNAVIVPIIDKTGELAGIYSVLPEKCSIKQWNNVPYLRLEFADRQFAAVELERCGIVTRFQYRSDFFGDKNHALKSTMELIDLQNQAIKEGVKNSATIRFIATLGNFSNAEDLADEKRRFVEANLHASDGGVLLFPNTYKDIRQVDSKPFVVDAEQERLIQENVFNYFGVNAKILQNSADSDAENAFYAGNLEWLAIQTSEVLTKMLFSDKEKAFGTHIELNSNRIQNMAMKDKIEFVKAMLDRGILKIDEVRDIFGYDALPDGQGDVTPIRGEFHFVEQTNEIDSQEEDNNADSQ